MSERIRLTISVSPEVHAIFTTMADAAGMSLGKCMGDWLADTAEGAQFVALKMVEARKAPKTVMREMQALVHGMAHEVDGVIDGIRRDSLEGGRKRLAAPGARQARAVAAVEPPCSPTGVKSPSKGKSQGRKAA